MHVYICLCAICKSVISEGGERSPQWLVYIGYALSVWWQPYTTSAICIDLSKILSKTSDKPVSSRSALESAEQTMAQHTMAQQQAAVRPGERRLALSDGVLMPIIGLGTFQGSYDVSGSHDQVPYDYRFNGAFTIKSPMGPVRRVKTYNSKLQILLSVSAPRSIFWKPL